MARKTDRDARASRLASGWTVEADSPALQESHSPAAAEPDARVHGDDDPSTEPEIAAAPAQRSAASLIVFGLLGGIYLLYTWVWLSWASYYSQMNAIVAEASGTIGSIMQQLVFWAAPFAPALWFVAVLLLHRGASSARIALWLIVGAVVLVPLPMFEFGGAS